MGRGRAPGRVVVLEQPETIGPGFGANRATRAGLHGSQSGHPWRRTREPALPPPECLHDGGDSGGLQWTRGECEGCGNRRFCNLMRPNSLSANRLGYPPQTGSISAASKSI